MKLLTDQKQNNWWFLSVTKTVWRKIIGENDWSNCHFIVIFWLSYRDSNTPVLARNLPFFGKCFQPPVFTEYSPVFLGTLLGVLCLTRLLSTKGFWAVVSLPFFTFLVSLHDSAPLCGNFGSGNASDCLDVVQGLHLFVALDFLKCRKWHLRAPYFNFFRGSMHLNCATAAVVGVMKPHLKPPFYSFHAGLESPGF